MLNRITATGLILFALGILAVPAQANAAPPAAKLQLTDRLATFSTAGKAANACEAATGQVIACRSVKYAWRCSDGEEVSGELACGAGQSETVCCAHARLKAELACEEKPDTPKIPGYSGTCRCAETY